MANSNTWRDKVVVVTGGSSGIGKATAMTLAGLGASVLITGRNEEKLAQVAAQSEAIATLEADSAIPESADRIVEKALALGGRIDLVVNNSSAGRPLPVEAYEAEIISNMCAVNILAPSLMVKAAHAALKESKGAIVNVGTAVSENAAPMLAHYAATKAALEHLTKSWSIELAPDNIRVNAVSPGPVKSGALTGMMGLPEAVAQQIEQQETAQIPLGRRGVTDDIVPWIIRLGSSENAWVTGQTLTVDGGWALRV